MLCQLLFRTRVIRRVPPTLFKQRLLHITRVTANSKNESPKDKPAPEEGDWDRTIKEAIEQARRELESSPKEPPQPPDDYVTTLGRVMTELPHQLEGFFAHGLDPTLFTEQIRFMEPRHSGMQLTGRSQYLGMARVLRIAMNMWFSSPALTVLLLRQQQAEESLDVFVRWTFEGMPRHSEIIGGSESRYEGEFRYRIHPKSGLICVHEVTAIHPAPPTGIFATAGPLARWMGWLAPRGSLSLNSHK
ncbi:hypothetical protein GGH91_000855 [Coemansia sp. RSA 2671]|nr:hypothetical protein IWW57_003221 [Coemansia sp. S610]KAJ2349368.1 hypothetical protein GGH91_000855 [Coemansia sp. RSA 2671]KAJ2411433.1 hypothetical protein GGI10_004261 [Coemansia sp. RSA 2530]